MQRQSDWLDLCPHNVMTPLEYSSCHTRELWWTGRGLAANGVSVTRPQGRSFASSSPIVRRRRRRQWHEGAASSSTSAHRPIVRRRRRRQWQEGAASSSTSAHRCSMLPTVPAISKGPRNSRRRIVLGSATWLAVTFFEKSLVDFGSPACIRSPEIECPISGLPFSAVLWRR